MNQNISVAVIGLGAMGMGAAQSCIRAGLTTYGADLNPLALEKLKAEGAKRRITKRGGFCTRIRCGVVVSCQC